MATPAPNEQSQGISTWDAVVPYRPGLPDFNGAALQNRANAPPTPATMPTANLLNGEALMIMAMGQVIPNARFSIIYQAGSPKLASGVTLAGVSPGTQSPILAGNIVVVRMPGGAASGDVYISWPANTFPPATTSPMATINGTAPGGFAADWATPAITTWSSGETVTTSTYNVPPVANGFLYKCTTAGSGTTAASASPWTTTIGAATTADANGVIWTCWAYTSGLRVVTVNMSNAATDLPFTVAVT